MSTIITVAAHERWQWQEYAGKLPRGALAFARAPSDADRRRSAALDHAAHEARERALGGVAVLWDA